MSNPSARYFKVEAVFGRRPQDSVFFVVKDELDRSEMVIQSLVTQAGFESPPPGAEMESSERIEKLCIEEIKESDLRKADLSNEIELDGTGGIKLWRLPV